MKKQKYNKAGQKAAAARTGGSANGSAAEAPIAAGPGAEKTCARCGRRMEWRAKWRNNWQEVKVCSEACRKARDPQGPALEAALTALAQARGHASTLCPSEATRQVFGEQSAWPQNAMERTRQAARRLIARGEMEMLQGGKVVDPSHARGPIRLRVGRGSAQR